MANSKTSPTNKTNRKRKRKKRLRIGRLLLVLLPVVLLVFGVYFFIEWLHPLKLKSEEYVVQYKSSFDPLDNVKSLFMDSKTNIEVKGSADTQEIGEYNMCYTYKGKDYPFTVSVEDIEAPVITLKDYTTDTIETVKAESFIESITDDSLYTYKLDNSKDTKEPGKFAVTITAKDQYGNESSATAKLIRKEDKQAPTLDGFEKQKEIIQGANFSAAEYQVVDNLDSNPNVYCDTSQLNVNIPGEYSVNYRVLDRSSNEATYTQQVTVKEDPDYGANICYLTFDDGPSANTGKILDILDQYDAKATFFVTGNNQPFDYMMKEVVDRGHSIGLHTYSHNYANIYSSDEAYFDDLQQISDLVERNTGVESKIIRFPGGSSNMVSMDYNQGIMSRLVDEVQAKGYQYFDWNGDSTDASGIDVPVEQLVANATSTIGIQKVNILFHDTDAKNTTVQALPQILQAYKDAGYVFRGLTPDSFAPHHEVNN